MTDPAPTVATRRRPDRPTSAPRVLHVARTYGGRDLYPWQRQVLDVACELLPDGRPAYRNVIVSVPRQAGKTELVGDVLFTRMLEGRACWYTAQTRAEAFDTFVTRWAPAWDAARFGVRIRRSAEMPGAYAPPGGSVRIFRPNGLGLHGKQGDTLVVDEAWAFDYGTGRELEQAAGPIGQTRPHFQRWTISTAGDQSSAYLAEIIASARHVEDTDDSRTAVFIWDATGVDPDDLAGILDRHPAKNTPMERQAFEHITAEYQLLPRDEFLRAYGNVWPADSTHDTFVARFTTAADPALVLPPKDTPGLVFTADATPAADHAAIVATWPTPAGPASAVVATRPGVTWISGELRNLAQSWRYAEIVTDALSMAAGPVQAANLPRTRCTDVATLCAAAGYLLDPQSPYRYRPDPALSDAAASMRLRKIADRTALGRSSSGAPVAALVALSLGVHAVATPRHAPLIV